MQTERVKEGMQMRTWDADKTFKTLQEYNYEFQNVERPICTYKMTYAYIWGYRINLLYIYIYIAYKYILYLQSYKIQPKLIKT